jgi:hypothetical protein
MGNFHTEWGNELHINFQFERQLMDAAILGVDRSTLTRVYVGDFLTCLHIGKVYQSKCGTNLFSFSNHEKPFP